MPQAATSECSDQMSMNFSALGRMVRRFPRLHLALSAVLAITVVAMALSPESGESHSQQDAHSNGPQLQDRLDTTERNLVRDALDQADGHKGRAAEILGISRHALKRRLQRLGLQ